MSECGCTLHSMPWSQRILLGVTFFFLEFQGIKLRSSATLLSHPAIPIFSVEALSLRQQVVAENLGGEAGTSESEVALVCRVNSRKISATQRNSVLEGKKNQPKNQKSITTSFKHHKLVHLIDP